MPLNKPAYMFDPLSLRLRKVLKRLCICENETTIDYNTALQEVKKQAYLLLQLYTTVG